MQKSNTFRSSDFHADAGDIIHILIIEENGDTASVDLVDSDIPQSPGKPTTKVATSITDSGFTANWYLNQNSTSYRLDVSDDPEFGTFVLEDHDAGDAITHAIAGLSSSKTYYFRVRAVNPFGTSISSDAREVTTSLTAVTDADGNSYTYVTIGTQQWMVENLKTTKYADGTPILNLEVSSFSDYFLASKDAVQKIYENLALFGVGGFSESDNYWSSSENNATTAHALNFTTGVWGTSSKADFLMSPAVRTFTTSDVYSLRENGESGGWIFHIIDNGDTTFTYYEALDNSLIFGKFWSDNTTNLIGTTSTDIGEGQNNTNEIIAQVGHTDSAAKLCDDLSEGGWVNDTTGAYCYYNNDIANKTPYGALYNWYAVDNAHGLAPTGWRVPDENDFLTLVSYLGGNSVAGGKLKEIGLTHWTTPNLGATDEYGFKALPTGLRNASGVFSLIGIEGYLSASEDNIWLGLAYNNGQVILDDDISTYGFAVRCMRDL